METSLRGDARRRFNDTVAGLYIPFRFVCFRNTNGAGFTKVGMRRTPASFWGQFHEAREPVLAAESFRSCYYLAIASVCRAPLDYICGFELDINCLLIGPLEKRSPLPLSEKRFQVGGRCSPLRSSSSIQFPPLKRASAWKLDFVHLQLSSGLVDSFIYRSYRCTTAGAL